MSKIEILAPVGNEEMLRAAVFSGADAVYLGFSGFNARTSANNFNADTLKDAVAFCHARGVAVHVALNTTVWRRAARAGTGHPCCCSQRCRCGHLSGSGSGNADR